MRNEELKPCPFCGKEPELRTLSGNQSTYYYIECRNFDCLLYCYTKHKYENYQQAIEAWNRRV